MEAEFKGYIVRRKPDGKPVYIGITKSSLARRWARHLEEAKAGANYAISRAIRKHGRDAFTIEHFWSSPDYESLKQAERIVIVQEATRSPHGYNCTDGGDGTPGLRLTGQANGMFGKKQSAASLEKNRNWHLGKKLSPESIEKVRVALRARMTASEETRRKISAAHTGKAMSQEARAKMSAAKKGKPGRRQSEEERRRRSETMRGRKFSQEHRANLSAVRRGKPGRPHTAESRAKLKAAWIRRRARNEKCSIRAHHVADAGCPAADSSG